MQKNNDSLNNLPVGKRAMVSSLTASGIERRRMVDLGLVNGASIEALHKSPSGDPTAYFIMGAVIALRDEDAKKILIQDLAER